MIVDAVRVLHTSFYNTVGSLMANDRYSQPEPFESFAGSNRDFLAGSTLPVAVSVVPRRRDVTLASHAHEKSSAGS